MAGRKRLVALDPGSVLCHNVRRTVTHPSLGTPIMATDTAPPTPAPTSRRNYWQLPTFAVGVAAAISAWLFFPPPPADPAVVFARDLTRLREALDRQPVDLATVESLTPGVAADSDRFPHHTATARFLAGSGTLAIAEADPSNTTQWTDAATMLATVDPAEVSENDQRHLAFRRAMAEAAAGVGDPKALVAALEVVPVGEDDSSERQRILAETFARCDPPNWKRFRDALTAYLSGPTRMPADRMAGYRLRLADAHVALGEPDKAMNWLREIGPTAPSEIRTRATAVLAKLAAAEGNWNEAAKQYEVALTTPGLSPVDATTYRYQAGVAQLRLGKSAAATPFLEQARQGTGPAAAAAALRLAEIALRDPAAKERREQVATLLTAAVAGARPGEPFLNPHLTATEVQAAFEEAIQVLQTDANFAGAVAVAEVYSKVAVAGRDRERRADVTAAWAAALQAVPATAASAAAKFKAAADDYIAMASTHPTPAGRGDLFRRAAACLRKTGDGKGRVAIADQIASTPGMPDEIVAAAWIDKGDALLAGNQIPEAMAALRQAMEKPGPTATQARVKLALAQLEQAKFKAKARTPEALKEAQGLRDLGQKLLAQVANGTADGTVERDAQAQALFELGKLLLQQANVPDAEARFRQLVQTHPTGSFAGQGKLYLGSCLLLLARGDNQDGRPPADADRKLAEALKVFEELAGSTDAFLRAQADIRLANTMLLLKRYDDLPAVCDKLAARYPGKVEELIVLSMLYSSYRLSDRAEQATKTFGRMEGVYARMTAADFPGGAEEYTREYWQKEWFDRLRKSQ